MRKVVLAMITTLNGRLDKPHEWVTSISGELDIEFNRFYGTFDTMLVGNRTYADMAAYWPSAETDPATSELNRQMATKLNSYQKYVFTRADEKQTLSWNKAEQIFAQSDDDIRQFVAALKSRAGSDIYLAGGAWLAQTFTRLGLIDEYRLFVYPIFSKGSSWFDQLQDNRNLELISTTTYDNTVVGLHYKPKAI